MRSIVLRGALIGSLAGIAVTVVLVIAAFVGPDPPGGSGERMMGVSLLLNRVGAPTTLLVVAIVEALGPDSPVFPIVYPLLLLAILFNWAMLGAVGGLVIAAWRRSRVTGKEVE